MEYVKVTHLVLFHHLDILAHVQKLETRISYVCVCPWLIIQRCPVAVLVMEEAITTVSSWKVDKHLSRAPKQNQAADKNSDKHIAQFDAELV